MGPSVNLFRASMVHSQKKKKLNPEKDQTRGEGGQCRGGFGKRPHFLQDPSQSPDPILEMLAHLKMGQAWSASISPETDSSHFNCRHLEGQGQAQIQLDDMYSSLDISIRENPL